MYGLVLDTKVWYIKFNLYRILLEKSMCTMLHMRTTKNYFRKPTLIDFVYILSIVPLFILYEILHLNLYLFYVKFAVEIILIIYSNNNISFCLLITLC